MKYKITIRATVTKDEIVEADSIQQATELAHEQFSVLCENGQDEHYDEETLNVEKISR